VSAADACRAPNAASFEVDAATAISVESLAQILELFLAECPQAVVSEDGEFLFDFETARYSVSGEGRCVLHIWSEERNIVRRVLDADIRGRTLQLQVLRFGKSQPNVLEMGAESRLAQRR